MPREAHGGMPHKEPERFRNAHVKGKSNEEVDMISADVHIVDYDSV